MTEKYVPKKEYRAYCIAALGQGMIYGIMSSYISDFYVNILRATPLFVLMLMLLARVWDAVNDPLMGMIMDRSNPKHGKMRTYIAITPIPIAILTFLLFFAPDFPDTHGGTVMKMVYAAVTYVAWGMIYTMSDVPFWSLPNAMTPNPDERGSLISVARTTNGVGSAIPMAIFMALGFVLPSFGLSGIQLEKAKYSLIAVIAAVIGNLLFVRAYSATKERVQLPRSEKRAKGEPGSLRLVFGCKPLMLTAAMGIIAAGKYMYQAGAIHVARYTFYIMGSQEGLGKEELEAMLQKNVSLVSTVFSVTTALGMFGTMLVLPALIKKFSYKSLLISTCLLGFAASAAMYIIGYDHFWACAPLLVVCCIPVGVINVVSYAMIADSLDYMEWKTGRRENGLGSACQSFVLKLGNAFSTSAIILVYMLVNLDLNTIGISYTANPLEMTHAVRQGMFSLVSIVPGISILLCIIPVLFYDLTGEKKAKITRELAEIRAKKGLLTE